MPPATDRMWRYPVFYGWRINQSEETRELLGILEAGESVSREPVYLQTAASHDGPDYGSTYAEVNLTAQHLIFLQGRTEGAGI